MSTSAATNWRFLIIEDDADIARQVGEAAVDFVEAPDSAEADICSDFKEGIALLIAKRYDLLILDLKLGDAEVREGEKSPGEIVFEELKKLRFLPVVFYTALAKRVLPSEKTFVRIVEKTAGLIKLKEEVRRVLATELPALSRHIDEVQRAYMWDFVDSHWKEFESPLEQADLAYMLARRLALELSGAARRLASRFAKGAVPASAQDIHPMEMYVRPVVSQHRLAGDILKGKVGEETAFWIVLTPSCDFEQKKNLDGVLLAECVVVAEQAEYLEWVKDPKNAAVSGRLGSLISDKREKTQPERFKYLPGTFFLPDLLVDFQRIRTVSPTELAELEVICSLDSPFGEAVLYRFARYFGRLGTPDIDKKLVFARLQSALGPSEEELDAAE